MQIIIQFSEKQMVIQNCKGSRVQGPEEPGGFETPD